MKFDSWRSWDWDMWTAGWTAWALFFVVWETSSGLLDEHEMLTNHLRPIFLSTPVLWFLAFGLWLWLGFHMLVPTLESWIISSAGG